MEAEMSNYLQASTAHVAREILSAMQAAGAPKDAIHDLLDFTWINDWREAEAQRVHSKSHRDFRVGAGLRWRIKTPHYTKFHSTYGYSSKDWDNGWPKYCGERRALDQAKRFYKETDLTGIVVVGPKQMNGEVLLCCHTCQKVLNQTPNIRPWTLVLGIAADQKLNEAEDLVFKVTTWNHIHEIPYYG